jgi:hypothetical protein
MAASKRVKARVERAAQAATGGKPPLWCEGPPWATPAIGPDYPPTHDANAWGAERWHGQQGGYRVELIAMRPPGHRAPTIEEGLAEVARRLKAGPPPALPTPARQPATPTPSTRPAPTEPYDLPALDRGAAWDAEERRREQSIRDAASRSPELFDPSGA